jgi:hypothetical protein
MEGSVYIYDYSSEVVTIKILVPTMFDSYRLQDDLPIGVMHIYLEHVPREEKKRKETLQL